MADKGASGAGGCNNTCGCDVPCPGGVGCSDKCTLSVTERSGYDHKICSCGEHCGCNPCTCAKIEASGTGRAHCKCSAGCACATCAA